MYHTPFYVNAAALYACNATQNKGRQLKTSKLPHMQLKTSKKKQKQKKINDPLRSSVEMSRQGSFKVDSESKAVLMVELAGDYTWQC